MEKVLMVDRYSDPPQEETLAIMEQHVRNGMGPEAALIDVLKEAVITEAFARTEFGGLLIRDVGRRATALLREMVSDVSNLTPEIAFRQQLALSQELGILRRIAAMIAGGKLAEARIVEREREMQAHSGRSTVDD